MAWLRCARMMPALLTLVYAQCGPGGGTTDLNVLKVASTDTSKLELTPLSWTEGVAVGSTLIDYKARRVLIEKLRPMEDEIPGDLESVISSMVDDQFRTFKCSFGVEGMNIPRLYLPIPGLPPGKSYPMFGIENSKLVITTDELQAIFDEQVDKMFGLIDQQLQIANNSHARETISYIIFSGGLSSSPYVQKRARSRYEGGGNLRLPNARNLKVLLAAEPQLAVCHGLVIARTQKIRGGTDIYSLKCSPISYGLLCREPYKPEKHIGDKVVVDEFTGQKWAVGQVQWIIRQGETVKAEEGIRHGYRHMLKYAESGAPQYAIVMMSTLPADRLPTSVRNGGTKKVCEVEFQIAKNLMKLKNRHWYNRGAKYWRAEYEVRAIIGTGLSFQIWGKGGLLSKSHDEIEVTWQPVDGKSAAKPPRPEGTGDGLYRHD